MKISVILITFNQEKYIEEALKSILMQQVASDYEVIIADDCSTDSTGNIIEKYREKYPEKIVILPAEKNIGITKNYQKAFKACSGDYIAVLEGDDVWTSSLKLKKQVDFLEEHHECSMCFNSFIIKDEDAGNYRAHPEEEFLVNKHILFAQQLAEKNFIGNFSACMYRKSAIELINKELYNIKVYDWMFNIACADHGTIGFIPENMSIYRNHVNGVWSRKDKREKKTEMLRLIDEYDKFTNGKFHKEFEKYGENVGMSSKKIIKLFIPRIVWVIIDLFIPKIFVKSIEFIKRRYNNSSNI